MEWNCNNCDREIISKEKGEFCLECWWKKLVDKVEITPESIRSFMEKYYLWFFKFTKTDYEDFIEMGVHENKISVWQKPNSDYLRENDYYYPLSKRNIIKKRAEERNNHKEYSAFLEKLFHFAEKEKIKRIRSNYSIEIQPDQESEGGQIKIKKILFKVSDIIIEKKTNKEIEKDEYKMY